MNKKIRFHKYLESNFKKLKVEKPLFYSWEYALRFELQNEEKNNEYFVEVVNRANQIYSSIFNETDDILIVYQEYAWRKRKIRKTNFIFKQLQDIKNQQILFEKFTTDFDNIKMNRAIVELKAKNVNHLEIFTALANLDFRDRIPQIRGEVYFVNVTKNIILNMYDDRGIDIIAKSKNTIAPLFNKFNHLILDYDREKINQVFKNAV